MFVPAIRRSVLRAAGHALVADDPVQPADIIVLSVGSDGAEYLEAADLVHSGIADKVAVFSDASDPLLTAEFRRRALPYEDAAARAVRELTELGVKNTVVIPRSIYGTESEGPELARWCDQNRFRSVVVVSSPDHSRRLRRVLHRSMKGHDTKIGVRVTRYLQFNPDHWWQTRRGRQTEVQELEKLLLDIARHPIS